MNKASFAEAQLQGIYYLSIWTVKEDKNMLWEIMVENFPNMMKNNTPTDS